MCAYVRTCVFNIWKCQQGLLHRGTSPPLSAEDTQSNLLVFHPFTRLCSSSISPSPSVAPTGSTSNSSSSHSSTSASSSSICYSSSSHTSSTKKRKAKAEEIDELLIKSLASLQQNKIAKTEEIDEDGYFGQQIIAATLRHFTPRQKAIAKLRMQQIHVDTEFTEYSLMSLNF